jgi:MFS family permease
VTYLQLLRLPSVTRLLLGMVVGRLPTSMTALALSLTLRDHGHDFGFIGAAVAVLTVSTAVGGPLLSRQVDRRGQGLVLVAAAATSLLAVIVVAALPDDRVVVLAGMGVAGLAVPPLEPCLRALWPALVPERDVPRAYALDSTAQEVIFAIGPGIVSVTVLIAPAAVALVLAGVLSMLGTLVFASSMPSRTWRGFPRQTGWRGPLRSPHLVLLLLGVAGTAIPVGGLSIVLVAYAEQEYVWGGASMLFLVLALGALGGALASGLVVWRAPVAVRLVVLNLALVTAHLIAATLPSVWLMAMISFGAGVFLPPLLVVTFGLVDRLAPAGTVVEAFAWLATLFAVGYALGAGVAGSVLETHGTRFAAVTTALLGLAGGLVFAMLRRAPVVSGVPA